MAEQVALGAELAAALAVVGADPATAEARAERLLDGGERRRRLVGTRIRRVVADVLASLIGYGWTPVDLDEIVRRRLGGGYRPALSAALCAHAAGFAADRVGTAWQSQILELGPPAMPDPTEPAGLARLLRLTGALDRLPPITEVLPPPGGAPSHDRAAVSDADHRQLARVRALLAKAESTTYDAEAEALTAKAQELISRYALARLLDRADAGAAGSVAASARRIWIEAPYVMAKAMLIDAVAGANRARVVISEALGFATVVGEAHDLDAVELLSTSLLVQANAAMLRHGRQSTLAGTSRTRSFRQSFLLAFGSRIGERLRSSHAGATRDTGAPERLLPVVRAVEHAVQAEFERRFPSVVEKAPSIRDVRGYAAGRAAADLALLDINGQIAAGAG